jgi:tRNA A37 N6-isopentenylltransferase MiaA/REP element-mobilizing transposase RayT
LYVKLLVDGMFEGPAADEALREELRAMGLVALRAELERIDPAAAARIHPNDERRTIRAIEVFRLTGKAISEHQWQWALGTPAFQAGLQPSSSSSMSSWLSPDDVTRLANADDFQRVAGFVGMDPYPPGTYGPVDQLVVHRRLLPHLALPGATYFVTWKTLHDDVLDPEEQQLALDALTFFDGKTCQVYAATIMSNHVHWIVRPLDETSLDELVTSVKRFSAREINRRRRTVGSVWQAERFDHIIRDERYLFEFLRYCVRNPVEVGACRDAGDYRWTRVHTDVAGSSPGLESRGTQDKQLLVGLDWPVELINRRINLRVKMMMERGFLDEVRRLRETQAFGTQSCEALGYKQLLAHLDGSTSLDDAVEQIKIQTRRFAKNQRTWLKRLRMTPGSVWIDATTDQATWVDVAMVALAPHGESQQ